MNGLDLKKIDWAITTTILILLSISVAFIYSAQFQSAGSVGSTWQRQIFFGLFGLGLTSSKKFNPERGRMPWLPGLRIKLQWWHMRFDGSIWITSPSLNTNKRRLLPHA